MKMRQPRKGSRESAGLSLTRDGIFLNGENILPKELSEIYERNIETLIGKSKIVNMSKGKDDKTTT